MKKRMNIYELDELIVRPLGRPMVWVYLVWCIYDGKAELRAVASDTTRANALSKMFRESFKFGGDIRGRLQVRIDKVEVDHGLGICMTSLTALDLDPQLQESRQRYVDMANANEKRTEEYLAKLKKLAKEREILS